MHTIRPESLREELFAHILKVSTAASHEALESAQLSKDIVSPILIAGRYADYLRAMHTVVSDVENRIFPMVAQVVPDLEYRRKADRIASDLKSLGSVVPPGVELFGHIHSEAFALGIFYVVEGSVLGGRYILQNIKTALPGAGISYFEGYGNATGQMWKSFVHALNQYADSDDVRETVIRGADHAFKTIHAYFDTYE